jgi:hypothetical protein
MQRPCFLRSLALTGALSLAACATAKPTVVPTGLKSPFTGYHSERYSDLSMWVCLPGRTNDTCNRDLSATEIRSDGSRVVVPQEVAKDAEVDCFYVYPTVDLSLIAGNQEDFSDLRSISFATGGQAALFGQVCKLYVPLYRQVTIGTYLRSKERLEKGLEVAFSDVEDAFLHYMGTYNHGRKIVLIGHSQGAEMVKRLLQRFFDDDALMRERLLLAMPIGGNIDVPNGQTKGSTFHNIPSCTKEDELACVVSYRSYWGNSQGRTEHALRPGDQSVCVNPASLADPKARAPLHAYFPKMERFQGIEGVTTPFLYYPDLYSGRCVDGMNMYRYLEIAEFPSPGGARKSPIDLSSFTGKYGTHVIDLQFPQGDLIEMVKKRTKHEKKVD